MMKASNRIGTLWYGLLFLPILFFILSGCGDDNIPATLDETPQDILDASEGECIWDNPHTSFFGLKGNVRGLHEQMVNPSIHEEDEDEEPFLTMDCSFDTAGRLTYYNATGVESVTRMLGVASNYYRYTYDETGRLTTAAVYALGEESPTVYTLLYDDSNRYVPMPFPLGDKTLFCVKGVKEISISGGINNTENTCSWISDKVFSCTSVEVGTRFVIRVETNYIYSSTKSLFPDVSVSRTYLMPEGYGKTNIIGELQGEETTNYRWKANGLPVIIERLSMVGCELNEYAVTSYSENIPLAPIHTRVVGADGYISELAYSYEHHGWPSSVVRNLPKAEENNELPKETYSYANVDKQGNWTECELHMNAGVDMSHWTGICYLHRDISYQE